MKYRQVLDRIRSLDWFRGRRQERRVRRLRFELFEARHLLAQLIWDGGGSDNNWSTAANWSFDVAPLAGDDLVFPVGAARPTNVNDLAAGTRFNTVLIQGSGYAISGNAIELAGGITANPVSGTNTFGLDITLLSAQNFVSANPAATLHLTGSIHTGNLIGTTNVLGTTALNFDGAGATNVTGVIDGGASLTKYGGGTLTLSGANTYEGITDVRQGVLRAAHDTALGSPTTGDTQIQQGASLHVLGGVTIAESFAIREGGVGFGDGTDDSTLGAIRSVGETNTLTGNIDLAGGNNLIGVDAGGRLIVSGVIANGLNSANRLIKTGGGALQLSGSQDNVYRGETRVLKGTLELNKSPGKNAIGGPLIIGDNIGGDDAATVKLLANDQIPQLDLFDVTLLTTTLASSGVLDLNGFSDTIGALTLTTGTTYSADVKTGAGVLTLGGTVTVSSFQGSSGATPAATISGNLDLGVFFSGGAAAQGIGVSRRFDIADTQLPNVAADLTVSANVTGGGDVSLTQTGAGTIRWTGDNSGWSGPYMVQGAGVLELGSDTALGTGLFSPQNGSLIVRAVGGSRTIANVVSLDSNVTFLGDDDTAGADNITFTGPVTLTGDRTILTMDPTQTVTFAGAIGEGIFANRTLNKNGRGTLAFTAANTYSGTTTLNNDGGTLVLRGAASLLNVSAVTVGVGATLRVDNDGGGNLTDRLNDATTITINGGRLHFIGASDAHSSEYFGTIICGGSLASTIEIENTSSGAFSSVVTGNALGVGVDRTVHFIGTGAPLTASGPNRISFVNNPGNLDDGVLNGSRVTNPASPAEFATLETSVEGLAVVAYPAAAYVTDLDVASATSNVKLTTPGVYALTTSKSINSLILGDGVTVAGAGATLTINSGNLMFRGAGSSQLNVGNLNTVGGAIVVDAGHVATIGASVYGGNIQKGGPGKLVLTGDNQTAGVINVNEGVLNIQRSTALGSPAGVTTVRPNATLEVEQTTFGPINVGLEPITLDGTGVVAGMLGVGVLRNVAGNNSWAGTVTVQAANVNLLGLYGGFGGVTLANSGVPLLDVATGTTLTITGDVPGGTELGKIGGGTLELSGVIPRTVDRNNRIFAGTLLLNNEAGVQASRGRYFIGTDVPGAPAATVRLGQSDQMMDDRRVEVLASGLFDLNGNSEFIGEGDLLLHVGPTGAGDVNIGAGGLLTINAGIQVQTLGTGNPEGATVTGGTLALQQYGVIAAAGARTWNVNDGATGVDLSISSTIVDGTGLQSVGVTKSGFGTLELAGTSPNAYTGTTTVNEGTLLLNKGSGSGGVNAMAGPLTIGDANPQSGFASSDVVRWLQPDQMPDYLALVTITPTGLLDLNGRNETMGVADAQTALSLQAAATVDLDGGTLTLIGNLASSPFNGATLWTPVAAPRVLDGTLALGGITRTIDVGGDRSELPFELDLSANLTGAGGFLLSNTGTLLLAGDNAGLAGDVVRTNGNFAIASDTAFGSGRAVLNGSITTFGGPRTVSTPVLFGANTIGFGTGFNIASVGVIGGGGNDLKFAGPVNVTAGNWFPVVPSAGLVEFAGGLGETLGGVFTRKQGYGTLILSSATTLSAGWEVGQDAGGTGAGFVRVNGGTVVLRDGGSLLNSGVLIGYGGAFQLDNSGGVLANRLGDTALVDLGGGSFAMVGNANAVVGEMIGQLRPRNNSSSSQVQAIWPGGGSATWRFSNIGLEDVNAGSNLQFVGRGADISPTGPSRIAFTTIPSLTDAIIPQAVLSGSTGLDFVTVTNATPSATPFDNFVGPLTSGPNFATTLAGATATVNVKLAASEAVSGTITANALLLPTGGLTVSGAGALTLDTGLLVSRGANTVSVAGLTLGAANGIAYVDGATSTLNIASSVGGSTTTFSKGGPGLLNLSGSNTYVGTARATGGILRASDDGAFGTTAAGVLVQFGATIELNGVNVPAETIQVAGYGESNLAAIGLRSVGGASVWQGNVTLNHNRTAIETTAGSSLTIGSAATAGTITNNGFNKLGAGTLQLSGTANNALTQLSILWQGVVELNKFGGALALNVATNPAIHVGDYVGGDNADVLQQLGDNQIVDIAGGANQQIMQVNPSGLYDLNGRAETFGTTANGQDNTTAVNLLIGPLFSGDVDLNGGTLTLQASNVAGAAKSLNIVTNVYAGGFPVAARIDDGSLVVIDGVSPGSAIADINASDSAALEDLIITANISGAGGIDKLGVGRLVLAPTTGNTYTGLTTLTSGETVVRGTTPLGATAGGTQVNSGPTLLLDGISLAEPLTLAGSGFGGVGALRNISGNNTLSGAVTLTATTTIGVNAGQLLDVNAAIGGGANGVTKLLPGTLRYSGGAAANTYTGTTTVSEGVLELNKNPNVNAITGTLTIGNDNGMSSVDVVRLLQSNQIADAAQVQVTAAGWLDLNNKNETLANAAQTGLNFLLASTTNPRVTTGSGVLTLGTGLGIQASVVGGTVLSNTASIGATISGNLDLGGVTHNLNVGDVGLNVRELVIDAAISNGSLSSSGGGLAYLTNNANSYAGGTTITAGGGIIVGASNALGTGPLTLGTTANNTVQLFASDFVGGAPNTITLPNAVNLNTAAANTTIFNLRGDDNLVLAGNITNQLNNNTIQGVMEAGATLTLAGTINLSNDASSRTLTVNNTTFGGGIASSVVGGTVTINGPIVNGGTSTGSAFTKGGTGLVVLTNNANSYAGATTVGAGNLRVTANGALGGTIAEQQTFGVTSTGGGSFTITYNSQVTSALNYSATTPPTASDVANALNALPSIARTGGVVGVTSSNPTGPSTVYTVTFGGLLSGVDVTQIASINVTAPVTVSSAIATPVGGGGGTVVNNGATLQVVPGLNITEPLTLNNNGVGNFGALRMFDVTPGAAEMSTWAGAVNFNAANAGTWAGVDGGGAAPDRLVLSGPVVSGTGVTVVKTGNGELEFGGNTDSAQIVFNGVSALDDSMEIRAGTVYFNKPQVGGTNYQALVGGNRITVGDGGGGGNADRLILSGTSLDQIGGSVPMTIAASGQLTMTGAVSEQVPGAITIQRLMGIAGSIDTSDTRTLVFGGNLDVANAGVTTGATPAATIAGNLDLGGVNRSFNTADSFVLDPAEDLVVSAAINSTAGNAFQKDGYGTLALTGVNSYPGTTTVNSGTLDFNASFTNARNVVVGGVLKVRDGGTLGTGAVNVNAGGTLTLDNSSTNVNRISDTATVTLTGGGLNLIGNSAGTTETIGTLTFNAGGNAGRDDSVTVDSSAGGVTNLTVGTALTRGASGTANFVGIGDDLGSTTNSRIQVLAGGSPFANGVIPWATMTGPAGYDLVTDADGAPTTAPFFLGRVTSYSSSVNSGGIVRLNGVTDTLTADRTVDALLLENGATVDGAFMLTVGTATAGLIVSASGSNTLAPTGSGVNPGVQFSTREPLFLIESDSTLTNSSTNNSSATLRKERGGTLLLSGDNDVAAGRQLTGAIVINAGTVVVSHDDSLGAEPGGTTTVFRRAALVFDSTAGDLAINNKAINVNGFGLNDDQTGALRTTGGANTTTIGTGATAVNWSTNPTFVATGLGTRLDLNANVGTGGNGLLKRGAGELVYSGSTSNSSTGAVSVNAGTLTLNKTGTALALNGALTVDDLSNFDDVGGGLVQYATTGTSTNMIGDVAMTVNWPGVFDSNGKSDTMANTLSINGGAWKNSAGGGVIQVNALNTTGGSLDTGSGTLNLNGNLSYSSGLGVGGQLTIAGNLNLVGGTRTLTVNDGYLVSDVSVTAVVSNGRLIKNGNGGLLLSNGGNSFLAGTNEVQRLVIAGATPGTSQFRVGFDGNTSGVITVGATDAVTQSNIQLALDAMQNILPGGAIVTVSGGGQFDITFAGHLGEVDLPNQITTSSVAGPGTYTASTPTTGVPGARLDAGTLSLGSPTVLGGARLHVLGSSQLLPVGGDLTLANPVTISPNITVTWGGRRDFSGTDDLTLVGTLTLIGPTAAQTMNWDVIDNQTNVEFSGVVSSGGDLLVPTKRGIGRLTLSGNNTFDVRDTVTGVGGGTGQSDGVRVEGGTLRITNSNALGGGATANVHVRNDHLNSVSGVLEIDGSAGPIDVPSNRNLVVFFPDNTLAAFGLYGRATTATGAIRNVAGTNSVAGIFDLRNIADNDNFGRVFVGVDAGRLTFGNSIFGTRNNGNSDIRNSRDLLKVGAGELEFTGTQATQYTGNTGVLEGTLILNRAPGVPGVTGPLVVGDNLGSANSDVAVLATSEQIPAATAVTVAGTGRLQSGPALAASVTNEVQQVQVGNVAPTGQFRLQFNGATTADINFGDSLASIQTKLNGLASIGAVGGSVLVLGAAPAQNATFTVTFLGSLAGANQPQLKVLSGTTAYAGATLAVTTLDQGGLTGRETIGALTLRMAPQATGNVLFGAGTTLSLNGDVTVDNYGALPVSAPTTAAIVGGVLELRPQFANGAIINRNFNVTADGPGADDLVVSSMITDGGHGSLANLSKNTGAASRMVLSGTNQQTGQTIANTGYLQIESAGALGSVLSDEVQSYVINNVLGNAAGQYTITTDMGTTVALDFNASANEVQSALETQYGVGNVRVVSVINGNTNVLYSIRWLGASGGVNRTQITLNNVSLVNASLGTITTPLDGGSLANAQTAVNPSGSLELDNVSIDNEQLVLTSSGVVGDVLNPVWNNGTQAATGNGALRNVSGDNTWNATVVGQGTVTLAGNPTTFNVAPGTTLTIGGPTGVNVLAGGGTLLKQGAGTLELGGTTANTQTSNTYINEGVLLLNKQGSAVAINAGEIMIGDNVGGDNADVLRYASTAGTNQIGDRIIRITSTGVLDLNGASDSVNAALLLDMGPTSSGDILTGAGAFTLTNTYNVVISAATTAASVPASIQGNVNLGAGTRTFDVRESVAPVELSVPAIIANGGVTKGSRGTLALSGNNTYTGATTVNADSGTLLANTPVTVAASPFTVNAGGTLGGVGTITGTVNAAGIGSNLTSGGIINPGPSTSAPANTGVLTINGNLTFSAGALLHVDINGTTAGTQYDQLVAGAAVTITGNAAPTRVNTSVVNGTTGYSPVNGVDTFKVLSKTSAGPITVGANSFLSQIPAPPPLVSPAIVTVGGKTYSTSYNTASGLNDGNDFVLLATTGYRIWDGKADSGGLTPDVLWSNRYNWVGDMAPFAGDVLLFGSLGVLNGRTTAVNDFPASTEFPLIVLANSIGSYAISGNNVTLNGTGSYNLSALSTASYGPYAVGVLQATALGTYGPGVVQIGDVTNSLCVAIVTQDNASTAGDDAQTFDIRGTLNDVGAVAIGAGAPLSITDGAGTGSVAFTATIDGPQSLSIDVAGDVSVAGALGGTTPLAAVVIANADDVTFSGGLAVVGNLTQTAGTGQTTIGGGSIGGTTSIMAAGVAFTANNFTSNGSIDVTAVESIATATNDVTVAAGLALQSTTGDVTFQAGDDIVLGSGTSVLATASGGDVSLASGVADTDDVGSQTLDGAVQANTTNGRATINANAEAGVSQAATGGVVAFELRLLGTNAIGSFALGASLTNDVTNLAASVGGGLQYADADGVTITTVGATSGIAAGGSIALRALDTSGSADDLVIDQAVGTTSGGVTLRAGDDVIVNAAVTATAAVTIDVDGAAGVDADVDVATGGSTVTIAAAVTAPSGTTISGGADNDTFNLKPSATSSFSVHGANPALGDPGVPPGDTLSLDLSGVASGNAVLTLGAPGVGAYSFVAPETELPVSFTGIESSPASGGAYHVVIDLKLGGFQNGVADSILAQLIPGGPDLQVLVNASTVFSAPEADLLSLTVIGSSDDEMLTIQETASGMPGFGGKAPAVNNGPAGGASNGGHLNATADAYLDAATGGVTAADVSIHFDGGGGTNGMTLNYATPHVVHSSSDTLDAANSGNLGVLDAAGTTLQSLLSYARLSPLVFSGAGGQLIMDASSTPAVTQMTVSDFGGAADGVNQVAALPGQGFETHVVSGFGDLLVRSGTGSETISVTSFDGAAPASPTGTQAVTALTLDANNATNTDVNGKDSLIVWTIPATVALSLCGGADDDQFILHDGVVVKGTIDGGTNGVGGDTLDFSAFTSSESADLTTGTATFVFLGAAGGVLPGTGGDVGSSIENLLAGAGNDVLTGDADVNRIRGNAGNDDINARDGVDDVDAGAGSDDIYVSGTEAIADTMQGGPGGVEDTTDYDRLINVGAGPVTLNGFNAAWNQFANSIDRYEGNGFALQGTGAANLLHLGFTEVWNTPAIVADGNDDDVTTSYDNDVPSEAAPGYVTYDGGAGVDRVTLILTPNQFDALTTADLLAIQAYVASPTGKTLTVTEDNAKGNFRATNFESARVAVYDDDILLEITPCFLAIVTESQIQVGTSGADMLTGTNLTDLIFGQDGDDVLNGFDGSDCLFGGAGRDTLNGGNLHDLMVGGSDNDLLYGGDDVDTLYGNSGNDALFGQEGHDFLYGGAGDDMLDGGGGNDTLNGESGRDSLFGNDGADVLRIAGMEALDDVMDGGPSSDTIEIIAGTGTATLVGLSLGAPPVAGLLDEYVTAVEAIQGNGQGLQGTSDANLFNLLGIQPMNLAFVAGLDGADRLIGSDFGDVLLGGDGDDSIFGNGGFDSLVGGNGNDYLSGGLNDDVLDGGVGVDTVFGDDGYDTFKVRGNEAEFDTMNGGANTDGVVNDGAVPVVLNAFDATTNQLETWTGNNQPIVGNGSANVLNFMIVLPTTSMSLVGVPYIDGGLGNDTITGTAGADVILGGGGDDVLNGGYGSDTLRGGLGNDVLNGGDGVDYLYGDEDDDRIITGAGRDIVYYPSSSAALGDDQIDDFTTSDRISFVGTGWGLGSLSSAIVSGNQIITLPNTKKIKVLSRTSLLPTYVYLF